MYLLSAPVRSCALLCTPTHSCALLSAPVYSCILLAMTGPGPGDATVSTAGSPGWTLTTVLLNPCLVLPVRSLIAWFSLPRKSGNSEKSPKSNKKQHLRGGREWVGGGERRRHRRVGHKDGILPRKSGHFEKSTKFLSESVGTSHVLGGRQLVINRSSVSH